MFFITDSSRMLQIGGGKKIDQSIMENDAFPRMLGLGALGVGLFGSCLKKNPAAK